MPNVFQITISAVDRATAVAKGVNQAIGKITKPISDVKASVQAFSKETGLDKLGDRLVKVGGVASDAARRIGSIAPPLAAISAAGSIAGLAAMAHGWGRSATEIANTASVIDVTTDQLQKYRGAARLAGLSDAEMTSGLKSVGSAFEDAAAGRNTFVAGVLSSKGIGIHRMADGSVDTIRALHDVSNAAARITNAQAREKFLGIFGLGGLAPLLSKGGAAIDAYVAKYEKLDATMTPDQIARGERFNENMVALDASFGKLKNSLGESIAPALTTVANKLEPIAQEWGPKIASWIQTTDWNKAADDTAKFVDQIGGVKTIGAAIAAITFAGPIASIATLIAQAVRVVTLLTTIATTTATGSTVMLGAAGYVAETARRKAFDKAIPLMPGESEDDRQQQIANAMVGGIATPDVTGPAGGGIGGGIYRWVTGLFRSSAADNKQTAPIVGRLEQMGWSPAQAAGIASNIFRESGYDPTASGDNGQAYGLGQWHKDRQEEFRKRFGKDIRQSSLDEQLQFIDYEMRLGNERRAGAALQRATSAAQAGEIVSRLYERPAQADNEAAIRAGDATAIAGRVHVMVGFVNAPNSMRATVRSSGNATASANVGTSALMGPGV
ncbi:phage tail tip lysozyme [Trinickia dinghuensis]|uniref:Phage tail lysozyme domain-containing protein n=1 Tax=Trinickia dinghuensis TaxID=2291023 RepID=A0A3D8K2Z9_9BURK|nr:phage tail tip lysozyme [Trinickia dinghuensis]RDU99234.1 hypothetical protein DWV00_08920 [Trinickia dinghuensis]